jgi:hypothetical protein
MLKCLVFLSLCSLSLVSAQGKEFRLPVVLPPFDVTDSGVKPDTVKDTWGTCLFYMENLGIVVFQGKSASPTAWSAVISPKDSSNKFTWNDDYVNCAKNGTKAAETKFTPQNFTFTVDVKTGPEGVPANQTNKPKPLFTLKGNYKFTLSFETVIGYGWRLTDVKTEGFTVESGEWLTKKLTIAAGSAQNTSVQKMDIGGYGDYNYGCSGTKVAVFPTDAKDKDKEIFVGVYFGNVQIQPFGYVVSSDKSKPGVHFSHNTADCVGTFTVGSLMGIIVSLVLASVLIFGFMMLNSVQGVDRFDDPKQKQLIINAKE